MNDTQGPVASTAGAKRLNVERRELIRQRFEMARRSLELVKMVAVYDDALWTAVSAVEERLVTYMLDSLEGE